jgi:hypothetical protein
MEIGQILLERDFSAVVNYSQSVGNNLSRAEHEHICQEFLGTTIPANNIRYIVKGLDDKYFFVTYLKDHDVFLHEKLTAR